MIRIKIKCSIRGRGVEGVVGGFYEEAIDEASMRVIWATLSGVWAIGRYVC